MIKTISNRTNIDFQLVSASIELVHKVLAITDCDPNLLDNGHIARATEIARKWNELFIDNIIVAKEGDLS